MTLPDLPIETPVLNLPLPDPLMAAAGAVEVSTNIEDVFGKNYISAYKLNRARKLARELAARKMESLSIYEALPEQEKFHRCNSRYRIVRGSNRAGKTLCAAVEVARAVTGQDPHGKYPKKNGTAFLVGKDLKHVGKVLYDKLFVPGAFKVIRDKATGRWRAFRPWIPDDAAREEEARRAPSLIPQRLIAEIAWENKKENVPSIVRLSNGWNLHFFSSLGKPPQGSPIDLFWFDEEIIDPNWYPEMAARVVDRRGRGVWSATPQAGTDQLYELHERAEKERVTYPEGRRSISEFLILLDENPHMAEEAKQALAADLSEEEARVRIGGEYAITSYKVYPTFSMSLHGHPFIDVPPHWTRYAYVDPGHRVCAVLFAAVPPPDEADMVLIYDELYLHEVNSDLFARAMAHKCESQRFQAFLIDSHMAIHTEVGIGKNVLQQYSEAMARHNVASISTGNSFLLAQDSVMSGVLAVQGMLRNRGEKLPRLRVMEGVVPNFLDEIKRYRRKRINGVVQEQPDQRKDNHLMDCLRYLALHDPKYIKQKEMPKDPGVAYKSFMEKMKKKGAGSAKFINLGPGGHSIWQG